MEAIKSVAVIIFALLILPIAFGEIVDTRSVSYLEGNILLEGNIEKSGEPKNIEINIANFPFSIDRQTLVKFETNPKSSKYFDSFDNSIIKFSLDSTTSYYAKGEIINNRVVSSVTQNEFPLKNIPESIQLYLEETNHTKITPEIGAKAREIVAPAKNSFEAATLIAYWINENIKYDLSAADPSYDANWVYKNKRAVCSGMTNLFMSMTKAVGIPSRYISGYAYGNVYKTGFEGHAWAEVWLGNWVPFDPTFFESGYLDATHIVCSKTSDADYTGNKISWRGMASKDHVSFGSVKVKITQENTKETKFNTLLEINAIYTKIKDGSYTLVEAKMTNLENFWMAHEITLLSPTNGDVEIIRGNEKNLVIFGPGETKTLYWILKFPESINNIITTYPFKLHNSDIFASFEVKTSDEYRSVSLEELEKLYPTEEASSEKIIFLPNFKISSDNIKLDYGEKNRVQVNITNFGPGQAQNVTLFHNIQEALNPSVTIWKMEALEEKQLPFQFQFFESENITFTLTYLAEDGVEYNLTRTVQVDVDSSILKQIKYHIFNLLGFI